MIEIDHALILGSDEVTLYNRNYALTGHKILQTIDFSSSFRHSLGLLS
jgi:hypothetical protein